MLQVYYLHLHQYHFFTKTAKNLPQFDFNSETPTFTEFKESWKAPSQIKTSLVSPMEAP